MLNNSHRLLKKIIQITSKYQHNTLEPIELVNTRIKENTAKDIPSNEIFVAQDAFGRLTVFIQNTSLYETLFPTKHILLNNLIPMRLFKTTKQQGKQTKPTNAIEQDISIVLQPKTVADWYTYKRPKKLFFEWKDSKQISSYASLEMIGCPNGYFTKGLEDHVITKIEKNYDGTKFDITFNMQKDEKGCPPIQIYINKPFWMSSTLITSAFYCDVMEIENPWEILSEEREYSYLKKRPLSQYPISHISFLDAIRFCNRLSTMHGLDLAYTEETDQSGWQVVVWHENANGYRLPTAFEWESAAKAENPKAIYSGIKGNNSDKVGWTSDNSKEKPVSYAYNAKPMPRASAQKQPNEWGFYDLTGNVQEMTQTLYELDFRSNVKYLSPNQEFTSSVDNTRFLDPRSSFVDGTQDQDCRIIVGVEPNSFVDKELRKWQEGNTIRSYIATKGGSYDDYSPQCTNASFGALCTFDNSKTHLEKLKRYEIGFRIARNLDFKP